MIARSTLLGRPKFLLTDIFDPHNEGGASPLNKSVAIIPKVGGALSMIAGTFIIRDVIIKWRGKQSVPLTSVIVFCISVADWLFSFFGCFLSTWMAPVDSGLYLAAGNTQSCTAQGFIAALSIAASMIYYAVLMVLYWLIVRFQWQDSKLSEFRIRLSFTLPPLIIALGIAIPPLFFGMYNTSSFSCFIEESPMGCEDDPKVDCTRGMWAKEYWEFFWAFNFLCNIIIIASVCMLIFEVLATERMTDKYLVKGQRKMRQNTMGAFWQGMRYMGAFLLAYFTMYIIIVYAAIGKFAPLGVFYAHLVLTPLLGLLNSYVYFRPRYISYRMRNPGEGRMKCLAYVLKLDLNCLRNEAGQNSIESGDTSPDSDLTSSLLRNDEEPRDESESLVI